MNNEDESVITTQPTLSADCGTCKTAGTFTITPKGAVAPNYEITYKTGVLTLTKTTALLETRPVARDLRELRRSDLLGRIRH